MNCTECQQRLQDRLDGAAGTDRSDLETHLAGCPFCRACHAAARRLQEGLRRLPPPRTPAGLTGRIVQRVLAERRARRRRRRWMAMGVAVAATVALLLWRGMAPTNLPPSDQGARVEPEDKSGGSLRESVTEASSAVVSLTRRTADETVGQGRVLLPVVSPSIPEEITPPALKAAEPPMRSLQVASEGISTGLEPVTSSARRALDLFLRDLPPMDQPQGKPGS
jgi:anti-sigma factor RsiW